MEELVSYEGLDEATVLHALYHGTAALGLGAIHNAPGFSVADAQAAVDGGRRYSNGDIKLDYVAGRPIKVTFKPGTKLLGGKRLYDRDAGQGECERIISELRATRNAS